MSEKRSALYTVILLSSIILCFTFADLVQADRTFSDTENKVLASRPDFSWEALMEGSYTQKYETYLTEQFVSRDKWITIKTYMDIALQKKEINGVYLGEQGYLIEQHLPGKYSSVQETKKLVLLDRLVKEWDARVMLVPTADNILKDKLPFSALYYDQAAFLEKARRQIGEEHYIDVYSALQQHVEEEIYYRTDHHWTTLGAYYGYLAWLEAENGEDNQLTSPYDTGSLETVAEDFLGTLHSKVNFSSRADAIRIFPETQEWPVTVTYDLRDTRDTCYEDSYLATKNKYGFFLDDNHGFVDIRTECGNGKTLFVIKDSYANCFIPLLIPYYERICVMDLRYFNGRLFGFMEGYEPEEGMDVLVLYNCIHFLEDFVYLE